MLYDQHESTVTFHFIGKGTCTSLTSPRLVHSFSSTSEITCQDLLTVKLIRTEARNEGSPCGSNFGCIQAFFARSARPVIAWVAHVKGG